MDEINTDDLEYPNTGLAGLKTLAIEQLSGDSPQYEFLVEGREISIPKVMNGEDEVDWEDYYWEPEAELYKLIFDDTILSWDGETYVERFSANPIWCLYDLMTNTRYGIGDYITTDDNELDYLLEMSRYCDEKISDGEDGWEKRFRMDVCIDSPQQALALIMQLSTIFKGLPFYSDNGKIRIAIDKPDTSVQLFGMGNIVKESFSQSWSSKRDIPNIVYVQYDNEDNYYQQEKIEVIDQVALAAGNPINKKDVRYYGTKLSYAIRYGRNFIKTAKYIDQAIVIRGGSGALIRQCGEVIDIAHDVPQYGFSGRVVAGSTTTKVKLDREITIEATKSYAIRVDFAEPNEDGSPRYEEKTVTDAPGTYMEVNVSEAFSMAPIAFDVYSFGEVDKVVFPVRIMSLKRSRTGEVEMETLKYNENSYDDSTVVIPEKKVSSLEFDIPPVEDLNLTEAMITLKDGSIESAIDVWFTKPVMTDYEIRRYAKARIYLSDDGGASYTLRGETTEEFFRIQGGLSISVEYTILVVSVTDKNEELSKASCPSDTITLVGKDSAPSDVIDFAYTFVNELVFTWDKNTDNDLAGYEIRTEDANWGVQNAHLVYRGSTNTHTIVRPASRAPGTYYIKAFDRSVNYSETALDLTPTNAAPEAPTVTTTIWFGMATLDWEDSADTDLLYYEVYRSHTNAWAGEEALYKRVSGSQANLQGEESVDAEADAADATSITDAELIGAGVDKYVNHIILQTSGTHKDQAAVITAFDNSNGKLTVASWPGGTPDIGDDFTISDRTFFKVRGVDRFGAGTFSSAVIVSFDPLAASILEDGSVTTEKLANEAVTAPKLYSGEIITLEAQIKNAIITDAKIFSLIASKITTGLINAAVMSTAASPNARIEIDGPNNVIKVYDGSNNLRVEIGLLP